MEAFLKVYLPLYITGFLLLVFVIPTIRIYRQTGINAFRFTGKGDGAHEYIGRSMKVFILLLVMTVMTYSFSDAVYDKLAPFKFLQLNFLKIAGLILGHLSVVLIVIAQRQMKQSWRIGIDYVNMTPLITSGLFSLSRNPIFLFLLASLLALFLILPNAITFAVLFAAYIVLQITMRLEEDFLTKQHGELYLRYKSKVRRLL